MSSVMKFTVDIGVFIYKTTFVANLLSNVKIGAHFLEKIESMMVLYDFIYVDRNFV